MFRRRDHEWSDILFGLAMVAIVIFGTIAVVKDCNKRAKCWDNGGHVENYNCRTVCHTDSNGFFSCAEHCDWRCVGANPEAR